MNIGISTFPTDYSIDIAVLARRAEELGFDSLWVQRHLDHREPDGDASCPGGHRRGEDHGVSVGHRPVEVVLRQPDGVEPELLGEDQLGQGIFDHLTVPVGCQTRGKREVPKSHTCPFWDRYRG